jgi:hypothetical protein
MKNMATPPGVGRLVLAEEKPGRDKRNEVSGEGMKMGGGGGGCAGMRSGEKVRWTPRWATWSEALAAGPEVFCGHEGAVGRLPTSSRS